MFFSVLGGGMATLANIHIVYSQTRSVVVTALVAVSGSLPPLLLPALSTSLAQRFGGPRTYITRYVLSTVIAFVPVVLLTTGHLSTVTVLMWTTAMSSIAGLFIPAASLVQRMLAPQALLPEFTAAGGRNAAIAGVIGILGGGVLSIGSLVGFVTVLGIAARNGIMLVSHYRHLEVEEGMPFGVPLVLRGAEERLAPILMTASCAALALLPLVISGNIPGHEIEFPMAVVILGGLVTSTTLNLFLLPVLYAAFGQSRHRTG
jgi:hypothetical protein